MTTAQYLVALCAGVVGLVWGWYGRMFWWHRIRPRMREQCECCQGEFWRGHLVTMHSPNTPAGYDDRRRACRAKGCVQTGGHGLGWWVDA